MSQGGWIDQYRRTHTMHADQIIAAVFFFLPVVNTIIHSALKLRDTCNTESPQQRNTDCGQHMFIRRLSFHSTILLLRPLPRLLLGHVTRRNVGLKDSPNHLVGSLCVEQIYCTLDVSPLYSRTIPLLYSATTICCKLATTWHP